MLDAEGFLRKWPKINILNPGGGTKTKIKIHLDCM
jgi:hypothetical protein